MNTKNCTKCEKEKNITDFNWKVKNKSRQSRCKECTREATNKHYQNNKGAYFENVSVNKERIKVWYKNFKSTLSCTMCPEKRTPCLDFHHVDGNEKEAAISRAVHTAWSIEKIKKEIEKCIVVCKNCHAMIHAK